MSPMTGTASTIITICLVILSIFAHIRKSIASDILYTISATGECGGRSSVSNCNPEAGDICAYIGKIDKSWCCKAGEKFCVGQYEECLKDTSGYDQITCSNGDTYWCCNGEFEICSSDLPSTGTTNLCMGNFVNPQERVPAIFNKNKASQTLKPATHANQYPLAPRTADPETLSTLSTKPQTTANTSLSPFGTTIALKPTSTKADINRQTTTAPTNGALIGGIVGGILVVIVMVIVVITWLRHHNRHVPARMKQAPPTAYVYKSYEAPPSEEPLTSSPHESTEFPDAEATEVVEVHEIPKSSQ